jgi:signal transduction histidine kinase
LPAGRAEVGDSDPDLQVFVRALAAAPDPQAFQASVVHEFLRISGAASACYCDLPPGERVFSPRLCSEGFVVSPNPVWRREGGLVKWLRANEQPLLLTERTDVVAYLDAAEREVLAAGSIAACIPLVVDHRLVGIVLLAAGSQWHPGQTVVDRLWKSADHAGALAEVVAQRHAERLRLEASARAQQLALAGQLAAAVAHEVRNPLATIRSSVQYVSDSSAEWSSKHEILQHVVEEVDRINRTLSAMLGLSRPQALEIAEVDLTALMRQVLVLVQSYVEHQHLVLDDSGIGPQVVVRGDPKQLQQVLLNVLLNACQSMQPGGRLTLVADATADAATIRVSDTGAGIAPAELGRVFDTFYTTKANGTGLGLPICKEIMARHRGTVDIESELGVGTTVTLSLPRLQT